jgi:hypothetical protein
MKTKLYRAAILALASTATFLSASCATTGDPSTGGIFWSETKAQDRLAERQGRLEQIERRTGQTERKSAQTQQQIDALR